MTLMAIHKNADICLRDIALSNVNDSSFVWPTLPHWRYCNDVVTKRVASK